MKVLSVCDSCCEAFSVIISKEENSFLEHIREGANKDSCPCPRLCGGKINLVNKKTKSGPMPSATLTGKQLYLAVCGMGLPDEIQTDPIVIRSLLKSASVSEVIIEQPDKGGRSYLHEIILDNGTTIHLSAGPRGACVLKITKDKKCLPGS